MNLVIELFFIASHYSLKPSESCILPFPRLRLLLVMYAPRVKATPLGGSALMTRRPASGPESDLILGMGTADTTTVPLWDLAQSEFLQSQLELSPMAVVVAHKRPFIFAVAADPPDATAGESFNWDFLTSSNLVYFHEPSPIFATTTSFAADAFHSQNPLVAGQQFLDGASGIQFPVLAAFFTPVPGSANAVQLDSFLSAFLQSKQRALVAAAVATHAPTAPGAPPAGTPAAFSTPGPPAQPVLVGFLVKDREGRQYSCLNKTESLARITELSAASRFISAPRFLKLFEHVEIDVVKIETRILKYGRLAQSPDMPDLHEMKSLGRAEDLSNLPLRQTKHAASFRRFILCDLRSMDQSVVGWWCFSPFPFKAWEHDSSDAGREQLRWCLVGMQDALGTFHDAVFKDVFVDVIQQCTHANKPFRHFTNSFVAVHLWILVCRPYMDAMDEAESQFVFPGTPPPPPMPIANPGDNYAILRKVLKASMEAMVAREGVWAERRPHEDFMDKEHGLFKQVLWVTKGSVPSSTETPAAAPTKLKRGEKRKAAKALAAASPKPTPSPGVAVVTPPPVTPSPGPCIFDLARQCKITLKDRIIKCAWEPKVPPVVGDQCKRGFHCDIASMTRKDCLACAKDSSWTHAPVVLAGFKAAKDSVFHP